jgi:hypothetical protein
MALPIPVKTWQYSANNAQAALGSIATDNKTLAIAIKNAILAFGTNAPTIGYSCSSTVAGSVNDGVDRWTTTANIVQNAAGSAHSWFVFKMAGGVQFLWSFGNGNATSNTGGIVASISPSAGFTGGSTTADPTATDQITVVSAVAGNFCNLAADAAVRWNVMLSTDGTLMRWFILSAGALLDGIWVEQLANLTTGTPGANVASWGIGGTTSVFLGLLGNTKQNGVSTATALAYESVANLSIASEISGGFDCFPISVAGTAVGARGKIGTLQDIWATSTGIALGDGAPASGTLNQFICLGGSTQGVLIPWNTTALQLT